MLQLAAVYVPGLAGVLGAVPLTLGDWGLVLPAALLPAITGQLLRLRVSWRQRREESRARL